MEVATLLAVKYRDIDQFLLLWRWQSSKAESKVAGYKIANLVLNWGCFLYLLLCTFSWLIFLWLEHLLYLCQGTVTFGINQGEDVIT